MKKVLYLLSLICIVASCSSIEQVTESFYGMSMKSIYESVYTSVQFDSICNADGLTANLSKWHKLKLSDAQTGRRIDEYLFIKRDLKSETIYRVVDKMDGTYKISKRITEK